MMFTGPPSAKSQSDGGKLKLIAVGGKTRHPLMPDVPTVEEAGVPGYELNGWFGILAPAKTPKAVLDRLTQEVRTAVADPRFSGNMTKQGFEIAAAARTRCSR